MEPVNDTISKNFLALQLDAMIEGRKFLIKSDVKDNSAIGFNYDNGYLMALLDLLNFVNNYKDDVDEQFNNTEDVDE